MHFQLGDKRVVSDVSCSCVSKEGKKCKHIASLIYYINNVDSATKTSVEQKWGAPSYREQLKDKYSKGKLACEMFPPPSQIKVEPMEPSLSDAPNPSALRKLLEEAAKDKCDHAMEIFYKTVERIQEFNIKVNQCQSCIEFFLNEKRNYPTYSNPVMLSENGARYYKQCIILSEDQIKKLASDTMKQSEIDEWFEARRIRISGTRVHSIITRVRKEISTLVQEMLQPKKVDVEVTRYGTENEPRARKLYSKLYSVEVWQVGVFVDQRQPWQSVSLDGVVVKNDIIKTIVEFKCPYSIRKLKAIDFANKKAT